MSRLLLSFLYVLFFSISFSILAWCEEELAENDPADSRWYINPKRWWILPVKINQLPQVGLASSSSCLLVLFLLLYLIGCRLLLSGLPSSTFIPGPPPLLTPQPPGGALFPCTRPNGPNQSLLFFPSSSSPPLTPPLLHPSHWVMAVRAESRPAAVGDRHWSHTQSLEAEGEVIHPFWPQPCSHWLYSLRPKQLQEVRLRHSASQINGWIGWTFNPLPGSLRWGLAVYILGLFITETGQPKLKPHTASATARTSVEPIKFWRFQRGQVMRRKEKPDEKSCVYAANRHSIVQNMVIFSGGY